MHTIYVLHFLNSIFILLDADEYFGVVIKPPDPGWSIFCTDSDSFINRLCIDFELEKLLYFYQSAYVTILNICRLRTKTIWGLQQKLETWDQGVGGERSLQKSSQDCMCEMDYICSALLKENPYTFKRSNSAITVLHSSENGSTLKRG